MVRHAAVLDALAAHELARRVEQHFVRVHVAVVVRRRDRLRIEVVGPRAERADHETIALERLMDRRRLVNAADDRLEVVDVEDPRVEVAVPSHDVERMVIENELVERVVLLDEDAEVAPLVVRLELDGPADVALAVRRTFEQLAELVAIPLGPPNVAAALEDDELRRSLRGIELPAMQDIAMDNDVVSLHIGEVTVHRFEGA